MSTRLRAPMLICCALSLLCGCVALKSIKHPTAENKAPHGVGYFLPNGHIKVSMTVAKDGDAGLTRSFSVATLYYPDTSHRYSIQFQKNLAADVTMNVGVSTSGLLDSASYTYTPKIIEAIQKLASEVRTEQVRKPDPTPGPCDTPGTYSTILDPTKTGGDLCNTFDIKLRSLAEALPPPDINGYDTKEDEAGKKANGIFFRMNRPYLITVSDKRTNTIVFSDIALSPTESSTQFLKLNRALFARNNGTITLQNGVLTGYAPNMDGEIESGFNLPASILKAYFDSVSALFTFRKGRAEDETEYLAAVENFRRATSSLEACETAYASGDAAKIEANCKQADGKK